MVGNLRALEGEALAHFDYRLVPGCWSHLPSVSRQARRI